MEISFDHRFIFIHVYRAGGMSVGKALKPYAWAPNPHLLKVPLLRKMGRTGLHRLQDHYYGHIKAKELKAALPEVFDDFFKFTFVRNPWAWHVSIYHDVRQRTDHPEYDLFRGLRTFEEYLEWRVLERPEQQREFVLSDDGELLVDFIGHHETLHEDFETVCRRVGIEPTLPYVNRSSHDDFREYYTDQTRALVAEVWKGDIDYFGFEFDEPQRLEPIVRSSTAIVR